MRYRSPILNLLENVLDPISSELEWIKSKLSAHNRDPKNDKFEAADLVGSWATQHPARMPDRAGSGTSDIDLMLVPNRSVGSTGFRGSHWDFAAKLEREFKSRFHRKIHLNVDRVLGGARFIRVWHDPSVEPW